jgi:hypothetical protein
MTDERSATDGPFESVPPEGTAPCDLAATDPARVTGALEDIRAPVECSRRDPTTAREFGTTAAPAKSPLPALGELPRRADAPRRGEASRSAARNGRRVATNLYVGRRKGTPMAGPNVPKGSDSAGDPLDGLRESLNSVRAFLAPVAGVSTAILVAIRSSFVAFVVSIGVVFVVASVLLSGHVLQSVEYGILSAMTFILGMSAFVYAALGKVLLRIIGYS